MRGSLCFTYGWGSIQDGDGVVSIFVFDWGFINVIMRWCCNQDWGFKGADTVFHFETYFNFEAVKTIYKSLFVAKLRVN